MKRILVIDDEEWLREMVHMALAQKGFEVLEAQNGAVGVDLARKAAPDLILCDVNMDTMDGYGTLALLRNDAATASLPFILMTGLADHAGMRHGMELGADDYLPKPFTIEALYAAVEARFKKVQTLQEESEKKLAHLRDNISLMLPHELRTPLNGILAYGEILSADTGSLTAAEVAEMGQVIHQSGKRLERLIENFLIYAQLEMLGSDPQKAGALLKEQTASPAALIEKHAQDQAQAAGRAADLSMHLVDLPVPMSEDYLAKITDELVQNAFKFSQRGTVVQVALSNGDGHVTLQVTDQGRGFSAEHIRRVGAYMQFDRKLHEQQGLGLGLTIVKRLTELHGGTMDIESAQGASTSVIVRLPGLNRLQETASAVSHQATFP
ncbi:MAG TPA: hybrid sensor histidine kinase/response regulator [Verrucomicrobiae bacterium]|nr:hybrid sensor histidine kinase/response regulator [Verrucomicrobiae bacterium]